MSRTSRPIFRRAMREDRSKPQIYVALKDMVYHNVQIKAGEVVDAPLYVLRSLFNKRRIGPINHPWTDKIIQTGIYRKTFPQGMPPSIDEVVTEAVVDTLIEEPKKKRVRRTKAQIAADEAAKNQA